jgi:hypothetical protein
MSANRKKNQWNVTLQDNKGDIHQDVFKAHWDPDKVSDEEIGKASAVRAFLASKKTVQYAPVKVELH